MVGFEVTPTTASFSIRRVSPPSRTSGRERLSIHTLCPSSDRRCKRFSAMFGFLLFHSTPGYPRRAQTHTECGRPKRVRPDSRTERENAPAGAQLEGCGLPLEGASARILRRRRRSSRRAWKAHVFIQLSWRSSRPKATPSISRTRACNVSRLVAILSTPLFTPRLHRGVFHLCG